MIIKKKLKKKIKKSLKKIVIKMYRMSARILPIRKDVIVFESNVARNYTGSPRAIYEEMVRRNLDSKYTIIWVFEEPDKIEVPGRVKKVRRVRFAYFFYMAVANIWVSDCRQPQYLLKRKNATYIQTWHGTPLKKLALDMDSVSMAGSSSIEKYHENFVENTRTWDYLLSQNHFSTETFTRCFDFHKNMLEIGYPRNDVLLNHNNPEYIKKLKEKLGLPVDKKVILYAPTWRDNEFYSKGIYKFVSQLDFTQFKDNLSEEYVLAVKYHYLVKENIDWSAYKGFVCQFNQKQDISELYLAADIMITDYSSVMFDYSLLKRPMFFYAYDLENYKNELRGFYFDFMEEAPGPISLTTGQLIEDIRTYNPEFWADKYEAFCKKYNHADDGNASSKVIDIILEKS